MAVKSFVVLVLVGYGANVIKLFMAVSNEFL
jgi:hypothetical protein